MHNANQIFAFFTIIKTQVKIIEKIKKRLMVLVFDKTKVFLLKTATKSNKLNKSYVDSKLFQIHWNHTLHKQ